MTKDVTAAVTEFDTADTGIDSEKGRHRLTQNDIESVVNAIKESAETDDLCRRRCR
ncbi:MAG: hypothetical protein ACLSG9_10670 [Eubacterium sp.]